MLHQFQLLLPEIFSYDCLRNDIQPQQHKENGHTGYRTDNNQYQLEHGHQDAEESCHAAPGIPVVVGAGGCIHLLLGFVSHLIGQSLGGNLLPLHPQPVFRCCSRGQQNGKYYIGDDRT